MESKKKIFLFCITFLGITQLSYSMEQQGKNILCTMPRYVLENIASFLPSWKDIISASSTCRYMKPRFVDPTKIIYFQEEPYKIIEAIRCIEYQSRLNQNKFALSILYDEQNDIIKIINFLTETEERAKRILELNIPRNQPSEQVYLPEEISKLKRLETLDFRHNKAQESIKNICQCPSLKRLYLSQTHFEVTHDNIQKLNKLEILTLTEEMLMPGQIEIIRQALPKTKIILRGQHQFECW